MLILRPHETNPFHPLESFLITKQLLLLWECVHPCGTNNCEYMTIAPVPLFKNSNEGPELFPIINRQEKNMFTTFQNPLISRIQGVFLCIVQLFWTPSHFCVFLALSSSAPKLGICHHFALENSLCKKAISATYKIAFAKKPFLPLFEIPFVFKMVGVNF